MLGLLWLLVGRLPTSFLPVEDQVQVMVQVTLPAGAKSSRTSAAVDQIQNYFTNDEKDNVDFIFVTQGFSFAGQGENTAHGFVSLAPWDKRKGAANGATMIANRATKHLAPIRPAQAPATTANGRAAV